MLASSAVEKWGAIWAIVAGTIAATLTGSYAKLIRVSETRGRSGAALYVGLNVGRLLASRVSKRPENDVVRPAFDLVPRYACRFSVPKNSFTAAIASATAIALIPAELAPLPAVENGRLGRGVITATSKQGRRGGPPASHVSWGDAAQSEG